ncbi:MAG: Rrf2 family transcriptional regulator [Chloroflexi bacterium]|nr:Rrf2 family transcriptional regulator [Chloroflexota bacterium]
MQLTRQADYAVRAVLDLSVHQTAHIKDIATRHQIPGAYLQKVLWVLSKTGVIQTMRGPRGGVRLTRPPQEITLLEVVEAAQGALVFTRCLLWGGECPRPGVCPTHAVWQGVQEALTRAMARTDFQMLAKGFEQQVKAGLVPEAVWNVEPAEASDLATAPTRPRPKPAGSGRRPT